MAHATPHEIPSFAYPYTASEIQLKLRLLHDASSDCADLKRLLPHSQNVLYSE